MSPTPSPAFPTRDIELLPVSEALIKNVSDREFASRELYHLRLLAEHALLVGGLTN